MKSAYLIGLLGLTLAACGGGAPDAPGLAAATPPQLAATVTAVPTDVASPTLAAMVSGASIGADGLATLDYGGFKLTFDCVSHAALRYEYALGFDNGTAERPSTFKLDPALPAGCAQQTTGNSYASVHTGFDRGHMVASNHMDYDNAYILRANYMTNILPQVSSLNQGIWLQAENVAECYRDIAPVTVYGGAVFGDTSNDYFLVSHGVRTPEYFWKTVVTRDPATGLTRAISWYIPNATGLNRLDAYIVSIHELEQRIGTQAVGIDLPDDVKNQKPPTTWPQPVGCNLA